MRSALVTGFGSFLDVRDNPSARLVRALHGQRVGEVALHGMVLDVSYARAPKRVLTEVARLEAEWVVGFGVSRRGGLRVERTGRSAVGASLDVDGCAPDRLVGRATIQATLDVQALARALGCRVSDDAGSYVCNAWLHQVAQRSPVPAAFVHIPPEGVDVDLVIAALSVIEAR